MRYANQRIKKYSAKISGDVSKRRTDEYKDDQVRNFSAIAGDQVMLECAVKEFMSHYGIQSLHTNYYILFIKKLISQTYEEACINFNKWCARGIPFYLLRLLARRFYKRALDLRTICRVDGLFLHLTGYEGSGDVVHDLSGNGNNGTVMGNSWTADGMIGACGDFRTDIKTNIRIEHRPEFIINNTNWTFTAWLNTRLPFATPPNANVLVAKGDENGTPALSEYALGVDDTNGLFMVASDGMGLIAVSLMTPEELMEYANRWVFCIFSRDGNRWRIYIDNKKVLDAIIIITINETESPVWLGGTPTDMSVIGGWMRANGFADELKFYTRTLEDEELTILYDGEKK